jgi:hypothetical protein
MRTIAHVNFNLGEKKRLIMVRSVVGSPPLSQANLGELFLAQLIS